MNSLSNTRFSIFHARRKTRSILLPRMYVWEGSLLGILGDGESSALQFRCESGILLVIPKCFSRTFSVNCLLAN